MRRLRRAQVRRERMLRRDRDRRSQMIKAVYPPGDAPRTIVVVEDISALAPAADGPRRR